MMDFLHTSHFNVASFTVRPECEAVTQRLPGSQDWATHLQQLVPGDLVVSVQVVQTESDWKHDKKTESLWRRRLNSQMFRTLLSSSTLTQQLVGPAVERLAGCSVLVLLVVLDGPEVSQSTHEAPEVDLVLSEKQKRRGENEGVPPCSHKGSGSDCPSRHCGHNRSTTSGNPHQLRCSQTLPGSSQTRTGQSLKNQNH